MSDSILLRATDINKSYDGVQALQSASFELRSSEVHALIGENGAGKSTLIKIITGAVQPDSGEIRLDERAITHNSPQTAKSLGIAAIYQQPALFPELTVAENIALGLEQTGRWGQIDWRERHRRAADLLARVGAKIGTEAYASDLTMPQQQLVEIVRALGAEAKVLIMDEPTASLSAEDTKNLFEVIRQLRLQGVGIIYISHRLEELPVIADRVTVLRDGRTVGTCAMAKVDRRELIQLMVGRELSAVFPKGKVELGDVVLELRQLGCSESGISNVYLSRAHGKIHVTDPRLRATKLAQLQNHVAQFDFSFRKDGRQLASDHQLDQLAAIHLRHCARTNRPAVAQYRYPVGDHRQLFQTVRDVDE